MSKATSTILTLVCALSLVVPHAIAQAVPQTDNTDPAFKDVNVGDDDYIAIKFLKDHHIVDGYADGTFQPLQQINRAEALKIILGTINKAPSKDIVKNVPQSFSDVDPNAWYAPYVAKGIQNGIISGYPDGKFYPE